MRRRPQRREGARITLVQEQKPNDHADHAGRGHQVATHHERMVRCEVEAHSREKPLLHSWNQRPEQQRQPDRKREDPSEKRIAPQQTRIGIDERAKHGGVHRPPEARVLCMSARTRFRPHINAIALQPNEPRTPNATSIRSMTP